MKKKYDKETERKLNIIYKSKNIIISLLGVLALIMAVSFFYATYTTGDNIGYGIFGGIIFTLLGVFLIIKRPDEGFNDVKERFLKKGVRYEEVVSKKQERPKQSERSERAKQRSRKKKRRKRKLKK